MSRRFSLLYAVSPGKGTLFFFLDSNAAGWGWFLDPTPWDGLKIRSTDQGEQDRMDLLTVIAHELGHLLGYEHEDDGVMAATLAAGERHLPLQTATVEAMLWDWVEEDSNYTFRGRSRLRVDF